MGVKRIVRSLLSLLLCFITVFSIVGAVTVPATAAVAIPTQAQTDAVISAIRSYVKSKPNEAKKGYNGATGCCAFVNYVWKDVFGVDVYNRSARDSYTMQCTSSSELYSFLSQHSARAGDVIHVWCDQCGNCNNSETHWMVIISCDKKGIKLYDAYGSGSRSGSLWNKGTLVPWNNSYHAQHYWNGNSKTYGQSGFYVTLFQVKDDLWLKAAAKSDPTIETTPQENSSTLSGEKEKQNHEITFAAISDGTYTLTPACATGSSLDVVGNLKSKEANVHIWQTIDGLKSQQWKVTKADGDYYTIVNENSGKALDVSGGKTKSGTNVWQYTPNGSTAQLWAFEDAGKGYYTIVPKNATGLCLDVSNGSNANGTNVQVHEANQTSSQKWKLTKVEEETLVSITLDPNGGNGPADIEIRTVGETYGSLPTPTRSGYIFDGWYTSSSGGSKVNASTTVGSAEFQILYAHWRKEAPKYTTENGNWQITVPSGLYVSLYSSADGTREASSVYARPEPWTIQCFRKAALSDGSVRYCGTFNDTLAGKKIDYWFTKANGMTVQDLSVINTPEPESPKEKFVIVTFDPNGGTVSQTSKQLSAGDFIGSVPTPTRKGYAFMGWTFEKDPSGWSIGIIGDDTGVYITEDTTLYAQWKEETKSSSLEGTYELSPKCAPKTRLDVNQGYKTDKTNIQIWEANGTVSQQFKIASTGDGYYTITAEVSGKRLDVAMGKKTSGTNVWQYTANSTDSQKWAIEDAGDGYYYIIPKLNSGLCLDVSNGKSANGTNVQVWTANQTSSQKWKLTPVD